MVLLFDNQSHAVTKETGFSRSLGILKLTYGKYFKEHFHLVILVQVLYYLVLVKCKNSQRSNCLDISNKLSRF